MRVKVSYMSGKVVNTRDLKLKRDGKNNINK